jgi:uncharacterized protein (TIGR03382 family)
MRTIAGWFTTAVAAVAVTAVVQAAVFTDVTNVNVLRVIGAQGQQRVTATPGYESVINGSASGPQFDAGATCEFVLDAPRTVGSYRLTFAGYGAHRPDEFWVRGWDGSSWIELVHSTSPAGVNAGSFSSPVAVTKIQFQTLGKTATGYVVPNELLVFADPAGGAIDRMAGHNILKDATVTAQSSPNVSGVWKVITNGSAGDLINKDYGDSPHVQVPDNGNGQAERAYVAFKLDAATYMSRVSMGFYGGQGWGNQPFEVYTATTDLVASLNSIGTYPTPAVMQAAGWTLQYQRTTLLTEPITFGLAQGGMWQYVVWVMSEGQSGAANEFEIFAPEPTALTVAALGFAALFSRRRYRRG